MSLCIVNLPVTADIQYSVHQELAHHSRVCHSIIPGFVVTPSFSGLSRESQGFSEHLADHLENNCGVKLSTGTIYGPVAEGWERLNIACPRKLLLEGLARIEKGRATFSVGNASL